MATVTNKTEYRCSDDCRQEGCPVHEASLTYQSVSDFYSFDNGKGTVHYFERGELETFIALLKELSNNRKDSVRID